MSDLIHANELMGILHDTAFKDGDDRDIIYSLIDKLQAKAEEKPDPYAENSDLREKLKQAKEQVEYNARLVEEERLKHNLYRLEGEKSALQWIIRFYISGQYHDRED